MRIDYADGFMKVAEYLEKHYSKEAIEERGAAAVKAGAAVMADALREEVPVDTGGLKRSITVGDVQRGRDGEQFALITFEGASPETGADYAFIAAKVEMGHVKDGSITHANPFIYRARKGSYLQVLDEMTAALGEGDE